MAERLVFGFGGLISGAKWRRARFTSSCHDPVTRDQRLFLKAITIKHKLVRIFWATVRHRVPCNPNRLGDQELVCAKKNVFCYVRPSNLASP